MEPQRPDATTADAVFDDAWRDHSGYLTAMATRILRDGAEAEDIVQEAFTRLSLVDLDHIDDARGWLRSEEHTSELQSLMRISYAVFCLKKKNKKTNSRSN